MLQLPTVRTVSPRKSEATRWNARIYRTIAPMGYPKALLVFPMAFPSVVDILNGNTSCAAIPCSPLDVGFSRDLASRT